MPHIIIELSQALAGIIDWGSHVARLHEDLGSHGYCRTSDLKTRVHCCHFSRCGTGMDVEHVAATLVMTNPRSIDVQNAMAQTILDRLTLAVTEAGASRAQICVFRKYVPKSRYRRHDIATS
ncbi:MAG: hypothetical protein ACRCTI_03770 [Beijerinckiaceae bacterium]